MGQQARRTRNISRPGAAGGFAWALAGLLGLATVGASAPPKQQPAPAPEAIAALVKQLGDDAYAQRCQAAKELVRLGWRARPALGAGLADADPEIRRACRVLMAQVVASGYRDGLDEPRAANEGKKLESLPCWRRYSAVYGTGKDARQLFLEMQKAEPALMDAAECGGDLGQRTFRFRLQQLAHGGSRVVGKQEPPAGFPALAAILFVATEVDLGLSPDVIIPVGMLLQQNGFQQAVKAGPWRPLARQILARWLRQPSGPFLGQEKLRLLGQYELAEAADVAAAMLRKDDDPAAVGSVVYVLARVGGKPYAALLVPLLKDSRVAVMMPAMPGVRPNRLEVRDMALAWLVELSGQSHAEYGMPAAKEWFDRMRGKPMQGTLDYWGLRCFQDAASRNAALKKFAGWLSAHPLPPPPAAPALKGPPPVAITMQAFAPPMWLEEKAPTQMKSSAGVAMAERAKLHQLVEAERLIDERSYAEAAGILGNVLADAADYAFTSDQSQTLYRRLKPAAEALLTRLPPEGLQEYELRFGDVARGRLAGAVAARNPAALGDVVARFFYTDAGAEAAYLLGTYHRSAGRFLSAAIYLRRLESNPLRAARFQPNLSIELATCCLKSHRPQAAREVLLRLAAAHPEGIIDLGSRKVKLFAGDADAVAWLERLVGRVPAEAEGWLMPGGNPCRNAAGADGNPFLRPAYQVSADPCAAVAKGIEAIRSEAREAHHALLPTLRPLVVGQTVLLRTATEMRAIDLAGGAVRWQVPLDDAFSSFLSQAAPAAQARAADALRRGLQHRLWEDPAFGNMTSDGRLVFGLEHMPFDSGVDLQAMAVQGNGRLGYHGGFGSSYNRLTAYDVRTGKLTWEAGGPPGTPGTLAGAFFVAAPLPLDGRLYAVAEIRGAYHLFALEGRTGAVLSDRLVGEREERPQSIRTATQDALEPRPWRGDLSPACDDGVLVCSMQGNRYVGLSLATGSLLWAYQSPPPVAGDNSNARMVSRQTGIDLFSYQPDAWCDPGMVIAAGYVVLTPLDAEDLICLRLSDGRRAWSISRRDGLYVGGIQDGKVLIVGRRSFRAVNLADGSPAWPDDVRWPAAAQCSGRGYLGATQYFVPLSSAEVAVVDLASGKLAARSRSPDGVVPGNLVHCGDAVVSQDVDRLCRFDLLPVRERALQAALEKEGKDARLLAELGEVLLDEGRPWKAILLLRAAKPAARTRQLLAEALVEGLRSDFDKFRPLVEPIDRLLDKPEVRVRLLAEVARGYQRAGQNRQALETYLKWIDLVADGEKGDSPHLCEAPSGPFRQMGTVPFFPTETGCARSDRLIRAGLADLWAKARPADRAELDRLIADRLRTTKPAEVLVWFAFHPSAQDVRLRMAAKLLAAPEKRFLEAEQLLECVLRAGSPAQQAEATARLASLLRDAGRPEDAIVYYRRLAGPLAEEMCGDGRRGREWVAALPADDWTRRAADFGDTWPAGEPKKTIETRSPGPPRALESRFSIWCRDGARNFGGVVTFREPWIEERNCWGRLSWKVPLSEMGYIGYQSLFHVPFSASEGCRAGHFFAAFIGTRLAAIDTLGTAGPASKTPKSRLLWLAGSLSHSGGLEKLTLPPIRIRYDLQNRLGKRLPLATLPSPLVLTAEYACFEQDHALRAVDPLSGKTLWIHDDLARDTDLFGDEELIFAMPQEANEALVLSAVDGRELGHRRVPGMAKRVFTRGRHVLTWDAEGKRAELTLWNAWTEKPDWQRHFDSAAKFQAIDHDELAVLDPKGRFEVIAAATGKPVFVAEVAPIEVLESIAVVRRSAGRYVLLTKCRDATPPFLVDQPDPQQFAEVKGPAYGFDARGKKLWSVVVPRQLLDLWQPEDQPTVLLCCNSTKKPTTGFGAIMRIHRPTRDVTCETLCLDARSGTVLHKATTANYGSYETLIDPGRRIEFRSGLSSMTLTFARP